jgi:hypothetical protein
MPENHADIPWLPPEFFANQDKVTPEELAQYAGQHLVWSWDGSQVLASAPERDQLLHKLIAAGIDPNRVVWDYVPPADVSLR